ncbi:MAG: ABC transporter ATP-binding protein [Candidatus Hodarchaeales archaeon]
MITAEGLTKIYRGNVVGIEDITMDLPKGSVGLLGPNGAGKTTFIRLLFGLIRPTSGSATIADYDIHTEIMKIRGTVGHMPELGSLPDDVSGMKWATHMGRLSGLSPTAALRRADECLHYCGLREERHRDIRTYSTGMRQRAKMALALVHDPAIIVADEPTSGMDPKGRKQMLDLITRLHKEEGKSVLVSSHLLSDIERICEYAVIFNEGNLRLQGSLKELVEGQQPTIIITIKEGVTTLKDFLEREHQLACTPVRTNSLEIASADESTYDLLFQSAYALGLQVRHISKRERTLEEMFLDLFNSKSAPQEETIPATGRS